MKAKTNRQLFILLVSLCVVLLITLCIIKLIHSKDHTNYISPHHTAPSSTTTYYEEGFMMYSPQSLEELVVETDIVIIGTVKEQNLIGNDTEEYKIKVEQHLNHSNNEVPTYIYVYQLVGTLKKDDKYLLFLNKSNLFYFPEHNYQISYTQHIIGIQKEKIFHRSPLIANNLSLDQLITQIKSTPNRAQDVNHAEKKAIITKKAPSLQEMIEEAVFIGKVTFEEASRETKYSKLVKVNTIRQYKNDLHLEHQVELDQLMVVIPAHLKLDEEYMMFAQYFDGLLLTLSIEGSVISKNQFFKWHRAERALDKRFSSK